MKNKEELRTLYAQRFKLPESAIDESILPILLALDDNLEASKRIADKVKGSIIHENNYYYNPLSAWIGMSAKFFFPSVAICFIGLLIFWGIRNKQENEEKLMQADFLLRKAQLFKRKYPELHSKYFEENLKTEDNETSNR